MTGIIYISNQITKPPVDGVAVYNLSILNELKILGLNIYEIGSKKGALGKRPLYNIYSFYKLQKICREKDVQIIHGSLSDGSLSSFLKLPYVHTVHGVMADEKKISGTAGLGNIVDKAIMDRILINCEKTAVLNADRVIVPSEYTKRKTVFYYGVSPRRIVVIPHGINISEFIPMKSNSKKESFIILTVCRLLSRKGLIYLLKALALLTKYYTIELRIVGKGPEEIKLKRYCDAKNIKNVFFVGDIPRKALIMEYYNCDVFCLPSLQEGFGLVLLEAMAAGKPVVATNVGSIPEVVDGGNTGLLVPPRDVRALSDALETLIVNPELRFQMGERGLQRAKLFSWKKAAIKLNEIYNSLL